MSSTRRATPISTALSPSRCCRLKQLADPERKRRFTQEAKAASALNHPAIVTIYDITHADGTDFIAMEYVQGKTLERVDRAQGPQAERHVDLRDSGRRRAGESARGRHRPPRPEAVEHHGDRRRPGEDPGLRRREAHDVQTTWMATSRVGANDDRPRSARDGRRNDRRHGGLYVTGAGRRKEGGRAVGHLQLRRGALRDGDWCPDVSGHVVGS